MGLAEALDTDQQPRTVTVSGLNWLAPSAGFEPAHTAPEADALSPELRGQGRRGYRAPTAEI